MVLVTVEVAIQFWHLGPARFTPGGEEVENDYLFAYVASELKILAASGLDLKIRSDLAAPGRAVSEILRELLDLFDVHRGLQFVVENSEKSSGEDNRDR